MKVQETVGAIAVDENGEVVFLKREYYGQGMVFKDWDAYLNRPDDPCYVAELSDAVYTANSFLEICNGQKEFADELFEEVDWQHPETLKEDWLRAEEWVECERCGSLVNYGDGCNDKACPNCGKPVEEPDRTWRDEYEDCGDGPHRYIQPEESREDAGTYEVVFDVEEKRYYCIIQAVSMDEALGIFFRNHDTVRYTDVCDHMEI